MDPRLRLRVALLAAFSLVLASFSLGLLAAEGDRFGGDDISLEEGRSFDVVRDAFEEIRSRSVDPPSVEELTQGAIEGMVRILKQQNDPYALFYSRRGYEAFRELTSGRFSGIGVSLKVRNGKLEIVSVLPGTPAQEEGLRRGDVILRIDGVRVDAGNPDQAAAHIKGEAGTKVTLTIERGSGRLEYEITRASIELPNLTASMPTEDVAYIRLYGFARGAGRQLRDEVDDLIDEGARGIVLDLRDNGGGLFSEAIDVASVFIENGNVVIYREHSEEDVTYEARGDAFEDVPVVVLVNEGTASASEIVAGALQDRERAVIVGTTTYGKGLVQEVVRLPDQSALKLTTAAYLTPDGSDINGGGISPDITIQAGRRAQRTRAFEVLEDLIASSGSQG